MGPPPWGGLIRVGYRGRCQIRVPSNLIPMGINGSQPKLQARQRSSRGSHHCRNDTTVTRKLPPALTFEQTNASGANGSTRQLAQACERLSERLSASSGAITCQSVVTLDNPSERRVTAREYEPESERG